MVFIPKTKMLVFNPNNSGSIIFSSFLLSFSLFGKRKVIDWVNTDVFNVLSQFTVYVELTKYLWAVTSPEVVHYSCEWEAANEKDFQHRDDGTQWCGTFAACFHMIL